jgi:hypothetical protein
MEKLMPKKVGELKRNDLEGALESARWYILNGKYDEAIAQSLYMLQDDPTEFVEKLNQLYDELVKQGKVKPIR